MEAILGPHAIAHLHGFVSVLFVADLANVALQPDHSGRLHGLFQQAVDFVRGN